MISVLTVATVIVLSTSPADGPRIGDGYVVEPEAIAKILADPQAAANVRIIDARPAAEFEKRRIKGSVWLNLEAWQKAAKARGFDDAATWHGEIGKLGVAADSPVVVVDGGKMTEAARIWFILKLIGHRDAAILNGGFALAEKTLSADAFESGPRPTPAAAKYAPSGGKGDAKSGAADGGKAVGLSEKGDVKKSIGDAAVQILDARTEAEFAGADKKENARGGHLPGAKNLPHARFIDESGRLRPAAEARKLLTDAGFKPDAPIIAHCQSGGRSSLAALAAARAGFTNVSNYYMSFGEWSADETCPIEASATPPAGTPASKPAAKP